ncbi:hypothetical protein [Novosphingobium colocasiae]|uniref:hypothetical protein n=1 Tax=Novosphingobium colocasiae TaxID=1256513 RepID=UPI0035AFFA43
MADRVSASITIGGTLPRSLLPEFAALVEAEGLSTEWDGEPFTLAMLREDAPLELMAYEVAWGRFEALESWCVAQGLPFARWSGAYSGQCGDERPILAGRLHRRR